MTTEKAPSTDRIDGLNTIKRVIPYLWPKGQNWVKYRVVIALLALVGAKLIAVTTPFFYKEATDWLAGTTPTAPWLLAVGVIGLTIAYGLTRFMHILFQELRNLVFARVGQRALRAMALETISHLHRLSLRFHLNRKTGALNRVIERGVKGVDFLLRFLLFNIVPLFLELALIAGVLVTLFDAWYLAIIATTIILYVWLTTMVTEWRVKIRKEMNQEDMNANQKAIDALLNFETVKYFGAAQRETDRYDQSMAAYEKHSLRTYSSLAVLNLGQAFIVNAGLVLALSLAAYDVSRGQMSVGDFVMVNAYMMQVMMPLNFLGFVYREIRQSLVDMRDMFALLEQPAEITDSPDARPLQIQGGAIEFKEVSFGYDPERQILHKISFDIEAGKTVAFVGSSGSGKSTIGRLLFRFYDVTSGQIKIDGQDIRDVTQDSLHQHIGVVPQDTVLFNETIYYNIAYGRPEASRAEIEQVAKSAEIHDFILSLPQGYETIVGERGLKLSGGEKQRIGIARTLLKDPPILILDEATSALDSDTESQIQACLERMGQNRSVITIAHRLSTIVKADQIIVLQAGHIIERGRHEDLIAQQGRYAQLWQQHLRDQTV